MKQFTSTTGWLFAMLLAVLLANQLLELPLAEAVTTQNVGTLSGKVVPVAGIGDEYIELSFGGIFGQGGYADLTNWTLTTNTGLSYDLSGLFISNTSSVRLCEVGATVPNCDRFFSDNDVFADSEGYITLLSDTNLTAMTFTYDNPVAGQVVSNDANAHYYADVHRQGDKIAICQDKQGSLILTEMTAKKLTNDLRRDAMSPNDVIPQFVFDFNKGKSFHPGHNWPEQADLLSTNCGN